MTQLYNLTAQWNEIQSMDFDAETLKDTLESIEGDIKIKAENIGFVSANMTGRINAIDAEIKRLSDMKKALSNRQEGLKDYLRYNMEACDIKKIECPLFSITLRKPVDVVVIDDDEQVPQDYWKVVKSVDKAMVKKALKDGFDVSGAHIAKGKSGLIIK